MDLEIFNDPFWALQGRNKGSRGKNGWPEIGAKMSQAWAACDGYRC
jgi:hypothetical protein